MEHVSRPLRSETSRTKGPKPDRRGGDRMDTRDGDRTVFRRRCLLRGAGLAREER
jgi:hypothetical protein